MMEKSISVAVLAMAVLGVTHPALAQTNLFDTTAQQIDSSLNLRRTTTEQDNLLRGQSVLDRARPDYDPLPVRVGSFNLIPAANLGATYNSNIFAVPDRAVDDEIWQVNPSATLLSNWDRHAVAFTGLGNFNYYTRNGKQDYQSAAVQGEGRYDIAPMTWLSGVAGYQRVSEARGGLSAPGGAVGPSDYDLYSGYAEAYRGVGVLKTKLDYTASYYDYAPLDLVGGGTVSQKARNRTQNDVGGEVEYEVTENFKPYVRGGYNWRNYTAGGLSSSRGYQLDAGSRIDFGGITTFDVYAGYLSQDYYNFASGRNNALDFGADILWNVTGLTSIEGRASRSIQETDDLLSPSALASQGSLQISHELRRNIVLSAKVNYTDYSFQNSARADTLYDTGAGARYFFNRHLHGDLTYDFERRESNAPGNTYDAHIVAMRLGVQY